MSSWFRSGLEEGQKSAGQKSVKYVLQYCHTFFTVQHLTGSWVHTYLLLRVAGFQPAKRMVLQDLFVHLSPYSHPTLEYHLGVSSSIGGYDAQDHDLGCIAVCRHCH